MLTIEVTNPDGTTTQNEVCYKWATNKDGALYVAIAANDPFYGAV